MKKTIQVCAVIAATTFSTLAQAEDFQVFNTGLVGYWPSVSGTNIAFMVDEWAMDADYNGDGEINHNVVVFYDTQAKQYTSTFQAGYDTTIDGNLISYYNEIDRVVAYYDISTGTNTNLAVRASWPTMSDGRIEFQVEPYGMAAIGVVCPPDSNINYYEIATDQYVCTGARGTWSRIVGDIIVFQTAESGFHGVNIDLNGDGDLDDWVIQYYDIPSGQVVNTGAVGRNPVTSGSLIAFYTNENHVGEDLNGDGQILGTRVIRYYDMASGAITNTGQVGYPAMDGSVIAYSYSEREVGQDINGDGRIGSNEFIGYYDIGTGESTNTGVTGRFNWNDTISGNLIAFETYENWVNEDLNGDGYVGWGEVVRYIQIPEPPSIPAIEETLDVLIAEGEIEGVGTANALGAFVEQAQAMLEQDQPNAASNILTALQNKVAAQSGKKIDPAAAEELIQAIQAVIDTLP